MPDSNDLRALIWDMGGVLVRNVNQTVRNRLAAPYGMTGMDLENLFFGNEVSERASLGQASEADAWEFVRQKLEIDPSRMPEFIATFWSGEELDEGLLAFSASLKPRIRIGLLSNAFPETRANQKRRFPHFFDVFDVTIFSAEVKMTKPDARIYHLAVSQLGVRPDEAVFVDDFIENVEGARAAGLQAIHFKDPQRTLRELKELFA